MPYPDGFALRTSGLYPTPEELFEEQAEELRLAHNRSLAAEARGIVQVCLDDLTRLAGDWEGDADGAEVVEELTTAMVEAIAGLGRAVAEV